MHEQLRNQTISVSLRPHENDEDKYIEVVLSEIQKPEVPAAPEEMSRNNASSDGSEAPISVSLVPSEQETHVKVILSQNEVPLQNGSSEIPPAPAATTSPAATQSPSPVVEVVRQVPLETTVVEGSPTPAVVHVHKVEARDPVYVHHVEAPTPVAVREVNDGYVGGPEREVVYVQDGYAPEEVVYLQNGHTPQEVVYVQNGHNTPQEVVYVQNGHTPQDVVYVQNGHTPQEMAYTQNGHTPEAEVVHLEEKNNVPEFVICDASDGEGAVIKKFPDPHSEKGKPNTNGAPDLVPPPTKQDIEAGLDGEMKEKYGSKSNRVPIQLEWRRIRFDVKVKGRHFWSSKTTKTVLHQMSGYVKPGEILAIMGPSGAGKTSMLNVLAQRELNYSGKVRVNGQKLPRSFRNFSCFVEQDDVVHPNLTVRQVLLYAAFLRLPTRMSYKEKTGRVREVIDVLGLNKCEHTKVGSPGGEKGISGGERKRLCIAVEILKRPSLLFLDEPTSGMDSKTSLNIVKAIRNLARTGTTVILTIHQPRSQILDYFDQLLLLADGQVAYHGPTTEVDEYFTALNPDFALPKGFNIGDHVIDLVARASTAGADENEANEDIMKRENERIAGILAHWKENHAHTLRTPPKLEYDAVNFKKMPRYSSNVITQYFVLLARNLNNLIRDRMVTMGKVFQTLIMVLFLGSLYFRMENNQAALQDRLGLLFFVMLSQVMGALFNVLQTFPDEYKIFRREHGSRAYSVASYYFAKTTAEIPHNVIFPFLFGALLYWTVGFHDDVGRFFAFLLILIVLCLVGLSLGEVISVIVPDTELALLIAPVLTIALVFFSGFYIRVDSIPDPYMPLYYCSPFNWGFEAFAINEFLGQDFRCDSDEFVSAGTSGVICPVTEGVQQLRNLGMDTDYGTVWINLAVLVGMIVVLKIVGFTILAIRASNWRSDLKRHLRNKREARNDRRKQHSESGTSIAED